MPSKIRKILFVDTNIWLDFYRARNEAGLQLLKRVESVSSQIIVTFQLEIEYKKNRQAAIIEGITELKPPAKIIHPGFVTDLRTTQMLSKDVETAKRRVAELRAKLKRALIDPSRFDPVYQTCQRIFHKDDSLVLARSSPGKLVMRRRAIRRFLHGCPPRKNGDTSFGDCFNWEWMVECARVQNAELVIVSRDNDYGRSIDDDALINDQLKQEFSERVSKKRKVLLYQKLSAALKHFSIPVSAKEQDAEIDIVASSKRNFEQALSIAPPEEVARARAIIRELLLVSGAADPGGQSG
ncbi:PIN domain-containing protein [Lysobacter antibioticus]|uniref:PIN domain-containing protein n=1 Tax=Lysobacter antibioticus TaxID=84531 RepID=UPI000A773CE4|nr:PIN domain-containing protein [Lysobacter antibioticus]